MFLIGALFIYTIRTVLVRIATWPAWPTSISATSSEFSVGVL